MQQDKRNVFVTGGTGFLGSHLIFSLAERGENIRASYRHIEKLSLVRKVFSYYGQETDTLFNRIEWIKSEISDYSSLKSLISGSDHVYHCAAMVSFENDGQDLLIKNNRELAINIVKACLETGVGKLCHVSSVAAIGVSRSDIKADEAYKWSDSDYHNAYAISKYLSESEVWDGIRRGLNAVIVNPSIILGPGHWDSGSSLLFRKVSEGLPFYISGVNGYVDVKDVVKSMIILMNSPVSGERFIISSENLSYRDLFSMIAHGMNVRKPFIPVPEFLSGPAKGVVKILSKVSKKKTTITPDLIRAAFSKVFFDNRKIKEVTGITFNPIARTIEETCRIFMSESKAIQ